MAAVIPTYLNIAKFAEISYAEREANHLALKGTFLTPQYSSILSVIIQAINARYNKLPNDPTLQATGEFMYALSGGVNTTPSTIAGPFIITLNPQSQTVTVGTVVSFTVAAANGTLPYTYQWVKDGVAIPGATSSTYTINPTVSGSAGAYDCIVTDNTGVQLTSTIANLVVNSAALIASWYWSADTDPYPALAGGTDNLVYLGTVPIVHSTPITIPWPSASANNTYKVVRYPIGEGVKTAWNNTILNNGPIPGTAYHEVVVIGSFLYIISRGDSIFTPYTVTYS
jgi:hypothetical protein